MGKIVFGAMLGVTICACVASTFPYKFYALDASSYTGTLKGPTASEDLLLTMCHPTEQDKAPCLVVFTSVFLRLKESYQKCQIDLKSAQENAQLSA